MSRKQHYRNNHGYIVSPKSRVVGSLPNGRTPWLINKGEPKHLLLVPGIWGWFPSWWTEGLTSGAKTWMVCPVPGTCISGKNRGLRSREPYRSHPTTPTFFKIRWYQHTKMLFFFPGLGIGPKKWRGQTWKTYWIFCLQKLQDWQYLIVKDLGSSNTIAISHRIHGTGIFAYVWLIFMGFHVGRYTRQPWILWVLDQIGFIWRKKHFRRTSPSDLPAAWMLPVQPSWRVTPAWWKRLT